MVVSEDWAEKFVISPARMLQSQYWAQIPSSIFVSVLAWRDSARWPDRHVLAKGLWVTLLALVQPRVINRVTCSCRSCNAG
jgi:hypothetical protein